MYEKYVILSIYLAEQTVDFFVTKPQRFNFSSLRVKILIMTVCANAEAKMIMNFKKTVYIISTIQDKTEKVSLMQRVKNFCLKSYRVSLWRHENDECVGPGNHFKRYQETSRIQRQRTLDTVTILNWLYFWASYQAR